MDYKFISAVNGGKGELDAWLECHSEDEIRNAIKYELNEMKREYEIRIKEIREFYNQ